MKCKQNSDAGIKPLKRSEIKEIKKRLKGENL